MMVNRSLIISIIGAIVAVLLQAVLAPAMAIGGAVPDFILAFIIARAVADPESGPVLAFVLGIIYDLMGSGPVGAMAFCCLVVSLLCSRLLRLLNNDTLFIPIVLIVAGSFLADVVYGILVVICGADVPLGEALLTRALPCGLYDAAIALVLYLVLMTLARVVSPARIR